MRYFLNILAAFEAVESLGEGVKADEFCPGWWQRVPSSSPLKVLGDDMGHLDHIGCCFSFSKIFKFEMQLEHCISNLKISPKHPAWMFNSFHFLSSFMLPVFVCGLSNKEPRHVVTLWQIKQVRKAVDFRRTSFTYFCKQRTDISICGKFPCPGSSNSVFECWMAENIWRAGASAWGRI